MYELEMEIMSKCIYTIVVNDEVIDIEDTVDGYNSNANVIIVIHSK